MESDGTHSKAVEIDRTIGGQRGSQMHLTQPDDRSYHRLLYDTLMPTWHTRTSYMAPKSNNTLSTHSHLIRIFINILKTDHTVRQLLHHCQVDTHD